MSRLCCSFSPEPLNPEWLPIRANSLSALRPCVCARKRRQRECVRAYISSSHPSFHRLSTPQYCTLLSLRPISLFLFCLHPALSPGQIFTLVGGGCPNYLFLSACLLLFYWPFCQWVSPSAVLLYLFSGLAVIQPVSGSLSPTAHHVGPFVRHYSCHVKQIFVRAPKILLYKQYPYLQIIKT